MPRSKLFHHTLPSSLDVVQDSSPLPFFASTTTKLVKRHPPQPPDQHILWNAREHRKQRYMGASPRTGRRRFNESPWARIARMGHIEYWNISWWVAVLFTLGSVVWVINGFQVFLPFVTSLPASPLGSGWSAWVGATIFAFGSVLLILEAWNRDEVVCFGFAVNQFLQHHHHKQISEEATSDNVSYGNDKLNTVQNTSTSRWVWWSTDRKYWHELGFVAGFAQLCGATIFWISGFTGIPEIFGVIQRHTRALDGAFWAPQVIGGTGFIISSILYMLEAQKKWYIPTFTSLGWHIGFWNFVGAMGFTLSGAFGFSSKHGLMYQSALSTFWGSWAFLIGSVLQCPSPPCTGLGGVACPSVILLAIVSVYCAECSRRNTTMEEF